MSNRDQPGFPSPTEQPDASLVAIVPAYNAQEFIDKTIECLLADACVASVVVVNDGSTDDTGACIDQCRERLAVPEKLRVIDQPNAGVSAARNCGIDAALESESVQQIIFVDADDAWFASSGAEVQQRFSAHPEAVLLVGARAEVYPGSQREPRLNRPEAAWAAEPIRDRSIVFEPVAFFGASGMSVCRRVLEAGVRFDCELQVGEDRDFACRALEHGSLLVAPEPLLTVRLHDTVARRHLTGAGNMRRWLNDHLRLVRKHCDIPGADDRLRRQTDWLLNHALRLSARHGMPLVDDDMWSRYAALYREMGWRRPWKVIRRRILPASVMRLFDR